MGKYPIIHQLDAMDCGAACLAMVSEHYGLDHSLADLRELTFVDRDGVSMLNISSAAEHIGLETLAVKLDYNQLQNEVPLPAIAHWDQNHFVVIYDVRDDEVIVGDPAIGERKISRTDFIKNWGSIETNEGFVLLLEDPSVDDVDEQVNEGEVIAEESTDVSADTPDRTLTSDQPQAAGVASTVSILSILKGNRKFWWHLILGSVVLFVIYLFLPLAIKVMVDSGALEQNQNLLHQGLLIFGILGLGKILLELSRNWIFRQEATLTNAKLVSNYLENLTKQPIRFFERRLKWDILQRVYDNYKVGEFFQSSSLQAVFHVILLLSSLIVFYLIDKVLFVVFFVGLLLQIVILFLFRKKKMLAKQEMLQQAGQSQEILLEIINGISAIKMNNAESYNQTVWENNQGSLVEKSLRFTKIDQYQKTILKLLAWAVELAILYFALTAMMQGHFSLGSMMAVIYILVYSRDAIVEFFDVLTNYYEVKLSMRRLSELSELRTKNYAIPSHSHLSTYKDIKIEGLSFKYGDIDSPTVLSEVNLVIPKGKKTAIVGVSGSGKTTLIKLLMGMYAPKSGSVRIGEVNVQDVDPVLLHKKMAAVFEDGHLFSDTIRANIAMQDENADRIRLETAIRIACLNTFMDGLPLGLETRLGDGGILLSKGQRQQVLLARAFYNKPEILFFDEATNALDGITERRLLKNIDEAFDDKTTVFVAHRLSTIKNADQIVVLHKGVIVEQGTHQELLDKKGAYFLILRNDLE